MQRARPAYDHWRDHNGLHIPEQCRVRQVVVDRAHGALASRLGKWGVVVRRSRGGRLYVRFDGEQAPVSLRPHLVRVLGAEQIIEQLDQLRDSLTGGTGHG